MFDVVYMKSNRITCSFSGLKVVATLQRKQSGLDDCVNKKVAKWIAEKRKQPRSGPLIVLSLFGRVIEGMREVNNRLAAE